MRCPRCGYEELDCMLNHERAGYEAAILCPSCDRQVCVIMGEPGDAVDEAVRLFLDGEGSRVKLNRCNC